MSLYEELASIREEFIRRLGYNAFDHAIVGDRIHGNFDLIQESIDIGIGIALDELEASIHELEYILESPGVLHSLSKDYHAEANKRNNVMSNPQKTVDVEPMPKPIEKEELFDKLVSVRTEAIALLPEEGESVESRLERAVDHAIGGTLAVMEAETDIVPKAPEDWLDEIEAISGLASGYFNKINS